jgi:hypothetical protein
VFFNASINTLKSLATSGTSFWLYVSLFGIKIYNIFIFPLFKTMLLIQCYLNISPHEVTSQGGEFMRIREEINSEYIKRQFEINNLSDEVK